MLMITLYVIMKNIYFSGLNDVKLDQGIYLIILDPIFDNILIWRNNEFLIAHQEKISINIVLVDPHKDKNKHKNANKDDKKEEKFISRFPLYLDEKEKQKKVFFIFIPIVILLVQMVTYIKLIQKLQK